ncbi:MAG: hypothetical protein SF029_16075 [bacterium]|nr:hypothetical protein [bacterium]
MTVITKRNPRIRARKAARAQEAVPNAEAIAESPVAEALEYSAEYIEKPGLSGINPLVLGITIMVGLMMWAGIFYLGYAALNWVF